MWFPKDSSACRYKTNHTINFWWTMHKKNCFWMHSLSTVCCLYVKINRRQSETQTNTLWQLIRFNYLNLDGGKFNLYIIVLLGCHEVAISILAWRGELLIFMNFMFCFIAITGNDKYIVECIRKISLSGSINNMTDAVIEREEMEYFKDQTIMHNFCLE